ncbi:MAG: hypothetical protein HQL01_15640 [Nitrospirae bacterium]|nr:hypothetical protein [Nitrospirota bacterium]
MVMQCVSKLLTFSALFPELVLVNIMVIYDIKARKSKGKFVIGRIQKINDIMRLLTKDNTLNEEGYDVILYLDKAVFTHIGKKDRVRIIRHLLRHIYIDTDSVTDPYKIQEPEIKDFHVEQHLNKDDVDWVGRLTAIAKSIHGLNE